MQAHVTPLYLTGLIICACAIAVASCFACFARRETRLGWKKIDISGFHWFALISMAAFSILLFCGWLFLPPEGPKPERGQQLFYWMGVAASVAATYCGFWITRFKKRNLVWMGSAIELSTPDGLTKTISMSDFISLKANRYGEITLRFNDDQTIKIDPYMNNFGPFMISLAAAAPKIKNY